MIDDSVNMKLPEALVAELEPLLKRKLEGKVRFQVKYHSGIAVSHHDYWVDTTATVKQLKQLLCEKVGIDDHEQATMFNIDGEAIAEEGDLSEYQIYEGGFRLGYIESLIIHLFPYKTQAIML
jgi:hypothetical protein